MLVSVRGRLAGGLLLPALLLAGCGGGGGGGGSTATPFNYPSSGFYTPVYRWSGSQRVGVSLVHGSTPATEYVVANASANVPVTGVAVLSDVDVVSTTVYFAPTLLAYVQGGTLYVVSLAANGSKPQPTAVALGAGAKACAIAREYVPYHAPAASQLLLTTAGVDGNCGTTDDGELVATLATPLSASTVESAGAGYVYLGHLDPGVVGQSGVWLLEDGSGDLFTDSGSGPVLLRTTTGTTLSRVGASAQDMLLQEGTALLTVHYASGSLGVTPVSNGTGSWTFAGDGQTGNYVYSVTGSGASATWTLLLVPFGSASGTVLGTGTGTPVAVEPGVNQVYLSTVGSNTTYLYMVAKNGSATQLLRTNLTDGTGTLALDEVATTSGGHHAYLEKLYQSGVVTGARVGTVNETGTMTLISSAATLVAQNVPASEPASSSLVVRAVTLISGYTPLTGASSGEVKTLDGNTGVVIDNGPLPSASSLGGSFLGWAAVTTYGDTGALFTGTGTGYSTSQQLFYFDPLSSHSLTLTTGQE